MNLNGYQYKDKDEEKSVILNDKNVDAIFGLCEKTKEFIKKENFEYTDDTIINLGKLYSESCN